MLTLDREGLGEGREVLCMADEDGLHGKGHHMMINLPTIILYGVSLVLSI